MKSFYSINLFQDSDRPIRISVSVFTDIIGIFHVSVSDRIGIFLTDIFSDANEAIFVPASVNVHTKCFLQQQKL